MKVLSVLVLFAMVGCAPQQHQSTAWTMSWSCRTQYCESHIVPNAWSGSGSFSSESDCVAWEAYFLNTAAANNGGSVTSCTGN